MASRLRRIFPAAYPDPGSVTAARSRTSKLQPSSAFGHPVAPAGARWGTGRELLAPFTVPEGWGVWSREAAMSIPTISRARDLLCSLVGSLPIALWRDRNDPELEPEQLAPPGWADRPDPYKTRNWILAWTADDLLFNGCAYWRITARYSTGFPSAFERMPADQVTVTREGEVKWSTEQIPAGDIVEFLSPIEGLLTVGWRAVNTALQLDMSAERFARMEIPAGILKVKEGGEPISREDLLVQVETFAAMRSANTIAGLNELMEYQESTMDPNRLQLTEARGYQALELARIANVPPYLVGAPSGTGMTYQNALQARGDLVDFGAMPYVNCIEQTLSGPNVTPLGLVVRLDVNAWLRSPLSPSGDPTAPVDPSQSAPTAPDTTVEEVPA